MVQIGGPKVQIVEQGGVVSFEAPKLMVAEEIVFEYTYMRDGVPVKETISVAVNPVETIERPTGYVEEYETFAYSGEQRAPEPEEKGMVTSLLLSLFSALRMRGADREE